MYKDRVAATKPGASAGDFYTNRTRQSRPLYAGLTHSTSGTTFSGRNRQTASTNEATNPSAFQQRLIEKRKELERESKISGRKSMLTGSRSTIEEKLLVSS